MTTLEASLPDLSSDYPLTPEQVKTFQQDGCILLRNVASRQEVEAYRPSLRGTTYANNTNTKKMEERDTYAKAFIQIGNLWERDPVCKRFVFARRFAKLAADLMGVSGVRMYHDQALFKEAGGGHTPWHQDQFYWPLDNDNSITMWMPLVDASSDMGTMTFAKGSHKLGYMGDIPISDQSEKFYSDLLKERQFEMWNAGDMQMGDATFQYGYTVHGAPGNKTDRAREVMTIIWIADGTRVIEPRNFAQKADLKKWFPGLKPGDLAASELNPLVYSR
jgi:ectoine hydroxylase-related dioxygenase (phytanoyl-CoA dioxygenase family)